MKRIRHIVNFNQKIKKNILGYRYLNCGVRLMKIGSFCLCVSLFTFTKTCLSMDAEIEMEHVGAVKKSCGDCCSTKNPVMKTGAALNRQVETVEQIELAEIPQELALHTTIAANQKLIFKIEGMCCPTEVDALKDALLPVVNKEGIEVDLAFDLINAKLMVESKNGNLPTKEEIIKAVAETGMQATLWNAHVKQAQEKTFWERYGRIGLNM